MTGCQPTNKHNPSNSYCPWNNGLIRDKEKFECICGVTTGGNFIGYSYPVEIPVPKVQMPEDKDFEWCKKQIEDLHALVTDLRCENRELKEHIEGKEKVQSSANLSNWHKMQETRNIAVQCLERIENLENKKDHHCDCLSVLEKLKYSKIHDRLENLEKWSHPQLDNEKSRIEKLESRIIEVDPTMLGRILNSFEMQMVSKIEKLEEFKNRQIDENRKISRRVDEITNEPRVGTKPGRYKTFCHHCNGAGVLYVMGVNHVEDCKDNQSEQVDEF